MRFDPKTKEELNNLLPEGEAEFQVIEAYEKKNKKNNDMLVLKARVAIKGKTKEIMSFLSSEWAIRNFAYSANLAHEYETGEITPKDCLSNAKNDKGEGKCIIRIEKGGIGDRGQYPDKNIIASYIEVDDKKTTATHTNNRVAVDSFQDDDIDF